MPPRRQSRRERLERQKEREEAREAGLPVREAPAPKPEREEGISYTGLFGGLLGAGTFFALAVAIAADEEGSTRLWSIPFGIAAAFFLPAIFVSARRDHPRRKAVLTGATVGYMLIAGIGLFTFGIGIAVLLAPVTALLAIGAGLVFQGGASRR